ncbi:MAG: ribulose-phosphate 3-epimerase [Ignavibacteriales bacterium]|nr:ribulose-phosphate 3-epimerase [Ignavibacteriales bacterium]
MKIIAPSILNADFSNLSQQVRYVEIGGADWLHCDIMDGHFVPNLTFGPLIVKAANSISRLPLDVHLMIENPDNYLESFAVSGAKIITVHQEVVVHLNRTLNRIKELGLKAGVSINPSTPVKVLKEVLEIADLVLIMSVNPGFGGQSFIEASLKKIKELFDLRARLGLSFIIEVDGGITSDNIQSISEAGCDVFVVGSYIFKNENISAATAELKNIVNRIIV